MNTSVFRGLLVTFFFSLCLYYGFFQNIESARTVAYIIAWFYIFLGVFVIFVKRDEKFMGKMLESPKTSATMNGFNLIFNLSVVGVFIYFESWFTAGFYLLMLTVMLSLREDINKFRSKKLEQQKELEETEAKKIIVF